MKNQDQVYKILLIGDSGVGKSTTLVRFCDNEWRDHHITTIGVDFKIHSLNIDDKTFKLQIWDTAGQERFKTITETQQKGANGALIFQDITKKNTFDSIERWVQDVRNSTKEVKIIVVGNKCDLKDDRAVSQDEGLEKCKSLDVQFMEISAKENTNVLESFKDLCNEIKTFKDLKQKNDKNRKLQSQPKDNTGCC